MGICGSRSRSNRSTATIIIIILGRAAALFLGAAFEAPKLATSRAPELGGAPPAAAAAQVKRMKKRKELNALIGLGGGGGGGSGPEGGSGGEKKRTKRRTAAKRLQRRPRGHGSASGHRLLRTESAESSSSSGSSSEDAGGFGLPGARSRFAKGDYLRCCKLCYPLCAFVILAACVVACVGLVWMQVALKEDLDGLKERFRTMESNQKTSFQEIPRLTEDLLNKQKELDIIKNGDMGLNKIWVNITEISKQISLLMLAVNHLKANIKSASDLINLPATVEDLQKSVATIGSTVTSVHHDVETMQAAIEAHKKSLQALQNEMSEHTEDVKRNQLPSSSSSSVPQTSEKNLTDTCKQDNQYLHTSIEEVNSTLMLYQKMNDLKLFSMDSTISNLSWRVTSLESHMMVVNKLEKKGNLTLGMVGDLTTSANAEHEVRNETTTEKLQNMEKTENGESQVSKLREKLQQISSLSRKPENDRSEALKKVGKLQSTSSKPTKLPRLSSRSASFERSRHPRSLSLPGISNIEDLQDLFRTTSQGTDGKLSYEDLQNLVQATIHDSHSFKEFDTDGDDKYTLPELRVALGV